MRQFYKHFPQVLTPDSLVKWIEQVCRLERGWFRRYPDEFLFLMLAEEYLKNHDDLVRALTHQFPDVDVRNEVRGLFISPKTRALLFELDRSQDQDADSLEEILVPS